ncbi:decarboxylase [Streptomyces albus subsp. albus]|nr:decarboxylase [Streptomyces albus subsp. albus]
MRSAGRDAVGVLHPGHREDDYRRLESLLGGSVRLSLARTGGSAAAGRMAALGEMGSADRLAAGVAELRRQGARAVLWAGTGPGFAFGWEGAHAQLRELAAAAGLPASSTAFAFVHALRELGATRVAVATGCPGQVTGHITAFLKAAGAEVVAAHHADAEPEGVWGRTEVLRLAGAVDHRRAQAVLLPDTALPTAAWLGDLEAELGRPVLTASQVTVWEGLRLLDRRLGRPGLGALFG